MKFNDETLMFLNVLEKTELIDNRLKNALVNCFFAINYVARARANESNNKLVSFVSSVLDRIAESASIAALEKAPKDIKEIVEPLEEIHRRFEEILITLGGETYRDHLRHSQRDFWLGVLLSKIKSNWDIAEEKISNFEDSWYLIARFHDFCYILQNIAEIVKHTEKGIVRAFPSMKFSMDVDISFGSSITTHKHVELLKYINPNDNPESFLTNISFLEQLENKSHSILSALFIIDLLHKEKIVPKLLSEEELKKIARAIALHTDSLTQAVLDPEEDFFGALLILVDEIQEWGRTRYEEYSPIIEEIGLDNLEVKYQKNTPIQSFMDQLLDQSGHYELPKLKFDIKEKFKNILVVERKSDEEFKITFAIDITNDRKFSKEMESIVEPKEREHQIVEHARDKAKTIISNLTSFGTSIGLEAVQLEPDGIISSRNEKSVRLELPLVNKSKLFPINADKNLLCIMLSFVFDNLSPYNPKNAPLLSFEDSSKVIKFNIPNLSDRDISAKKRNLYRLNAFEWDWGIEVVSEPSFDDKKEHIFPIKDIKDL